MDVKKLSFEQLRDNYLSGVYDFESDEEMEAGDELFNKLIDIKDLIPLLESKNETSVSAASYIAQEAGSRSRPIFPILLKLLKSEWGRVRYEVCYSFGECATESEHYLTLLSHLEDPYEPIRLLVISGFMNLDEDSLSSLIDFVKKDKKHQELVYGLSLLLQAKANTVDFGEIKESIINGNRPQKIFSYLAGYLQFKDAKKVDELVRLANDADIFAHREKWRDY
ncbi:hypothetical protein JYT75_00470 [Oceanicaulis sp. AH-315-P02]|nr:hypothetical protein [Robiginitomaculum sp.]MBN4047772.1 hypothetical protein [Oceanicaulis sp. AH-315-P02]